MLRRTGKNCKKGGLYYTGTNHPVRECRTDSVGILTPGNKCVMLGLTKNVRQRAHWVDQRKPDLHRGDLIFDSQFKRWLKQSRSAGEGRRIVREPPPSQLCVISSKRTDSLGKKRGSIHRGERSGNLLTSGGKILNKKGPSRTREGHQEIY